MGDYKTRTLTGENADHAPGDLPISRAVAASSAFPPAFDPLKLEHDWFNPRETVPATPKEAEEFARLEEEKRRDRAMVDFERCTKSNREDCAGARDTKLLRARDEAESRIDACAKDEEECTKLVSLYDYVTLTDAGVYDNLGWIALKRDWKQLELDYVIVSDASMPAGSDSRPPTSGVGALRGAISIMSQRSRTLEIREVMALKKEGSVPRSLFFSINSKPPKDSSAAERRCAEKAGGVGTDLKSLSPDEMRLLTGRGGSLVEARLRDNTDLLVH